jgi:hypothetical protein
MCHDTPFEPRLIILLFTAVPEILSVGRNPEIVLAVVERILAVLVVDLLTEMSLTVMYIQAVVFYTVYG